MRLSRRFTTLLITLLTTLLLTAGCSTTGKDGQDLPLPLNDANVISVTLPGVAVTRDTKLAWYSDIVLIRGEKGYPPPPIIDYTKTVIQDYLQDAGAQFVETPGEADYLVGAAFVADNALSKEEMAQRFRLYPTLLSHRRYDTGTLVVGLLPPAGGDARWRGAIQIYNDNSLPDEVKRQRVRAGVARLLDNIPRN